VEGKLTEAILYLEAAVRLSGIESEKQKHYFAGSAAAESRASRLSTQ
jgi:hypothetical protein